MSRKVIAYKNVFDRENPLETDFDTYLNRPEEIFLHFNPTLDFKDTLFHIKNKEDKQERNLMKRNFLPAVDLSQSGLLAIDIDGISKNTTLIQKIIERLKKLDSTMVIKESVSGNIVAFFKYDCSVKEYPFLYYKIYLELTLLLGVNIDFLPEIGRLRYISTEGFIYQNEESTELTEIFEADELPHIRTSVAVNEARNIKYGSR